MTEGKDTLKIIDDTISAVKTITEALNKAKDELIALEESKSKLETEKKGLEIATKKLAEAKNQLEGDKKQLEIDKKERDEKIGAMSEEQERLLKEYAQLKEDLAKFAKIAEEAEEAEFNFERIRALLSIYTVLIEKIFQGQPHYRILYLLNAGDKEVMTRDEIKNTTGIGGAFVLRAVQELAKVDLVEYDMDNSTVKLTRRLFEKKALNEK